MNQILSRAGMACAVLLAAHLASAQRWRNSDSSRAEGWIPNEATIKTAREAPFHSVEPPVWTNAPGFGKDAFTFARVRYTRRSRSGSVWWNGGFWFSDFPDSDLNLSYRLQQMTALRVDPNGRVIDLDDPELANYPWIYMVEPGLMVLDEDEVPILRKYLLNGGFMMADDFWGEAQWLNFERELKRVFPERTFSDLQTDHPLFHAIYDLPGPNSKLQVPNVLTGRRADVTDVTWEIHENENRERVECKDMHIRALFDDKQRLMVVACYNTDYGDGWEREGEDTYFFHRFSENIAYPMAINIIFYAMTH